MLGATIDGKYRILRVLGEGGMGCVYEAETVEDRAPVALKLINKSHPSEIEVSRFRREARAASAADTEHVARVLDAGMDPETNAPYMVLELLAGEDLQHLLDRAGPLEPDTVLRIAAQACLGLEKTHAAGVIHRDIKPANLFLARRGTGEIVVKILDFGIAKIKKDMTTTGPGTPLTVTNTIFGTLHYLSPEQAQNPKGVDQRTDLWSLGVVLYRALSGRVPHQDVEFFGELIVAICKQIPRSIQEQDLAPWVPPGVASVVHRALRLDADARFATATEMLGAIRPLLRDGFALHDGLLIPAERSRAQGRGTPPLTATVTDLDPPVVKAADVSR